TLVFSIMVNNIVVRVKHIARLNESKEIKFQLIKRYKDLNTFNNIAEMSTIQQKKEQSLLKNKSYIISHNYNKNKIYNNEYTCYSKISNYLECQIIYGNKFLKDIKILAYAIFSSCCDKLFRSFVTGELCCVGNGRGCASRVLAEGPVKRRPIIDENLPSNLCHWLLNGLWSVLYKSTRLCGNVEQIYYNCEILFTKNKRKEKFVSSTATCEHQQKNYWQTIQLTVVPRQIAKRILSNCDNTGKVII
ncbi:hypothetical protein AGLY_011078, partial [Aphis glycines]